MHEEIKEQVELGEHLLPFGLKCVVFPFAIWEYNGENITSINFLPFCMGVSEALPVTLRLEHRLMVFENRVLRKMFGCQNYVELYDLLHTEYC